MTREQTWERVVGDQTPEEFMTESTGHGSPWMKDEILTAACSYCNDPNGLAQPNDAPVIADYIMDAIYEA